MHFFFVLIVFDESNSAISFTLTRPRAAILSLQAAVNGNQRYRVSVLASNTTLDGFGQALRASQVSLNTAEPQDLNAKYVI